MSGWGMALLATIALLAPAVTAGTEAVPEVTDATGDDNICVQAPACTGSQDFLDIQKGWVDVPDQAHVAFHLEVAGMAPVSGAGAGVGIPDPVGFCPSLEGSIIYAFHFQTQDPAGTALFPKEPGGAAITDEYLTASRPCDTSAAGPDALGWGFSLAYTFDAATGGAISQAPVAGSVSGNQFTWLVERSNPGVLLPAGAAAGYQVANLAATAGMYVSLVAVSDSGDFVADQAPDTGVGTPFVFGGSASAKPLYATITTPAFTLAAKNPTKTNQTYVYNWTNAQADVDVTFGAVARSGTAHVLVKDSANATVLDKTFPGAANGTFEAASAKTGKWQVTVTYANFTGDVALAIAKHEATSTATPTPTSTGTSSASATQSNSASASASGSSSSSASGAATGGSTSTKGSPGVGLLVLVAALGAAVVAVRRRL